MYHKFIVEVDVPDNVTASEVEQYINYELDVAGGQFTMCDWRYGLSFSVKWDGPIRNRRKKDVNA